MNKKEEKKLIVLLTGTIDASVFNNTGNKITNVEERLQQYESSIENYIKNSVFDNIVFAENSGYKFNYIKYEELANTMGKQFEYVPCPAYVYETVQGGKSYGEARLIEDALTRSMLLKDAQVIYKITGRIFLKNSKEICSTMDQYKNEFLVYECKKWCFTNIFKFTKEDYVKYFDKVYERCDEETGNDVERVFFDIVSKNSKSMDVGSFRAWPYLDGIQGATLEPYSGRWLERVVRNILCKLGCFHYGTWCAGKLRF